MLQWRPDKDLLDLFKQATIAYNYARLFQPEMAGFGSKISYKTENHP